MRARFITYGGAAPFPPFSGRFDTRKAKGRRRKAAAIYMRQPIATWVTVAAILQYRLHPALEERQAHRMDVCVCMCARMLYLPMSCPMCECPARYSISSHPFHLEHAPLAGEYHSRVIDDDRRNKTSHAGHHVLEWLESLLYFLTDRVTV